MISIITISFGVIIFVVVSICAIVSFLEKEKRAASILVARVLNAQICVPVRQFPLTSKKIMRVLGDGK